MDDIQKEYDEFEAFMKEHLRMEFSEFDQYKRKKLGHYFDQRDNYFKLWFVAKSVYQAESEK